MVEADGPSKAEAHGEAQRERILGAAQACFVRHGFHAASMARIAETAGMSPGLIYRYFESKNAIILAIIERQLEDARSHIASLKPGDDPVPLLEQQFVEWQRGGEFALINPTLLLEMTAEASREPQIAEALAAADRVTGEDLIAWLKATDESEGRHSSEMELEARAFLLRCTLAGLAVRAVREPKLERSVVRASLERVLPQVLK